ncbi:MAG: hypothetical protein IAE85_14805 [Anaerolinea sp.]|nr:hypothetical protein [Anaerolinea sp.]
MIDIWVDAFAGSGIDLSFEGTNCYIDKGNRQRMNDYAAGHLVSGSQVKPGYRAHDVPGAWGGCECPSGERNHGFGIFGRFEGHSAAQTVDLAPQVRNAFQPIRQRREKAFGPVQQFISG